MPVGRSAPRSFVLLFGLVGAVVGIAFLIVGFSAGSRERALARDGRVVQGTVVDKRLEHVRRNRKGGRVEESTSYIVRYRFPTGSGTAQESEQAMGEGQWRALPQDGSVAIRYLPSDPSTNRLDAVKPAGRGVFLIVAAACGLPGLVLLVIGFRTVQRATPRG